MDTEARRPDGEETPRGRPILRQLAILGVAVTLVGLVYAVFNLEHAPDAEPEPPEDTRAKLKTLGYVGGSEISKREATAAAGVVARDEDREAESSYSMWTALAWDQIGDPADRARLTRRVQLIDDAGTAVHEWVAPPGMRHAPNGWANMTMAPNGDLVVVDARNGIVRLDWDSKLVWARPGRFHHEAQIVGDSIWGMRANPKRLATSEGPKNIWSGTFIRIDLATGDELEVIDAWDALRKIPGFDDIVRREILRMDSGRDRSDWSGEVDGKTVYDVMHHNSLHVLTDDLDLPEGWRAGDILSCFRNVDVVALFDGETHEVKWHWGPGELDRPHDPTLVDSKRVLIFDNGTARKWSRVVEVDVATKDIAWEFRGSERRPFFSQSRGLAQRLTNGDTLISESTRGKVFQINREGQIVWEFISPVTYRKPVKARARKQPTRAGDDKRGTPMRAALRMVRLEGEALQATRNNLARGGDGSPE